MSVFKYLEAPIILTCLVAPVGYYANDAANQRGKKAHDTQVVIREAVSAGKKEVTLGGSPFQLLKLPPELANGCKLWGAYWFEARNEKGQPAAVRPEASYVAWANGNQACPDVK